MTQAAKQKKIVFLSDVDYFKGGAERCLFDFMETPSIKPYLGVPANGPLSEEAAKHDIQSIVVDFDKVLTIRRPFKIKDGLAAATSALKAAKSLRDQSKENAIDAVHTNGLKAHGVACMARVMGGPKVITHYHSIPHTPQEKLFWRFTQILASKMVFVSRPCWHGKSMPQHGQVIFNGMDPMDPAILPKRPKDRKPLVLGFVGRIHPSKGVHDLINWFEYAYKEGLDIRLSLRGEAAPDEPEYDEMVRKMVVDKGLSDVVTFEGRREGYDKIYGDMDVNVVSSVTPDPLPRSVMEASALGIPVLGYPAGGIPDMIDDGKNGFLIKNGKELHATLKRLIEEKGLFEEISKAALENARNRFSMDVHHQNLQKLYQDI